MVKEAKYKKICRDILAKILSGQFPKKRLPSIRQLADDYKVSLMTANRAVKELEESGIVQCCVGNVGTIIDEKLAALHYSQLSSKCIWTDISTLTGKAKEVRYLCNDFTPENKNIWNELINFFNVKYPWIEVEILKKESIDCELTETREYDVLQLVGRDVADYQHRGFLMDITKLVNSSIEKKNFLPHTLDSCVVAGKFFSLPAMVNTPIIFYNKKSLGTNVENLFKDWNSFTKAVKATVAEGKYSALDIGLISLLSYFIGDVHNLQKVPVDKEILLKLVNILKYLTLAGPNELTLQHKNLIDAFKKQDIDFFCTYSSCIEEIAQKCAFEWGFFPMPVTQGGHPMMETAVHGINPESSCKKEAWLFIKFMCSEEGQEVFSRKRKYIPANKMVFDNHYALQEPISAKILKNIFKQASSGSVSSQNLHSIYSSVSSILEAYYISKCKAEETIEKLIERIKEILDLEYLY